MPSHDSPSQTQSITRPVYLWVEKYLKKMVAEGIYSPGDKIPSERELSGDLKINRATIRKAIENLITQGVLERRSSSGTFVRKMSFFERPVGVERPQGLTEGLRRMRSRPGSILLHFSVEKSSAQIAEKLAIPAGQTVLRIRRLRTFADEPICIETIFIPQALAPDLFAEDLTVPDLSLYELLDQRYAILPDTSMETLRISYATEEEAELLRLKAMDPVLLMCCITCDANQQPFEYLVSVNHPDRVVFESRRTNMTPLL